jgi:(2S)-methylsuccinyl-CoA dehydrogenase
MKANGMTLSLATPDTHFSDSAPDAIAEVARVTAIAEKVLNAARSAIATKQDAAGNLNLIQADAHGLSWLATYVASLQQLERWAKGLESEGRLTRIEHLLLLAGAGEYAAQISGGIPMSQGETVRLTKLGVPMPLQTEFATEAEALVAEGTSDGLREELGKLIRETKGTTTFGDSGLDDVHSAMQDEMRRFCEAEVLPHAQRRWPNSACSA